MDVETYKSEWQKYSQGDRQAVKGLYAENASFESLGKSSTGKQVRTKEEHFSSCDSNNIEVVEMRLLSASDSHMVWANRFTADGLDGAMAVLIHETIENGKITQSVGCRAPAP